MLPPMSLNKYKAAVYSGNGSNVVGMSARLDKTTVRSKIVITLRTATSSELPSTKVFDGHSVPQS